MPDRTHATHVFMMGGCLGCFLRCGWESYSNLACVGPGKVIQTQHSRIGYVYIGLLGYVYVGLSGYAYIGPVNYAYVGPLSYADIGLLG